METEQWTNQLDVLSHELRKFPLVLDAISRTRDLLTNPGKYRYQTVHLHEEPVELRQEIATNHPLASVQYTYEVPATPAPRWLGFGEKWHTFLQVHFKLASEISTSDSKDFGIFLSLTHAMTDESGKILPATATQYELVLKSGLLGKRLTLLTPTTTIKEEEKWVNRIIRDLSKENIPPTPYETRCWTWTGNEAKLIFTNERPEPIILPLSN